MMNLLRSGVGPALISAALVAPAFTLGGGDQTPGHFADLHFGPILGGQPIELGVESGVPNAPLLVFFGFGSTPTIPLDPSLPVIGVSPVSSYLLFGTDASGRFAISLPTIPGQFPAATGLRIFTQAVVVTGTGQLCASRVKACEVEPAAATAGFLVEAGAAHLPAGWDSLGANFAFPVDYSRDGRLDLVLATDTQIVLWTNDGSGHFTDESALRIANSGEALNAISSADVDNDGDQDLLTGGGYDASSSVSDRLFRNDGLGFFTEDSGFPQGNGLTFGIESGDLDGDGDLDLLLARASEPHLTDPGGKCQLYFNDGSGNFSPSAAFAAMPWNNGLTNSNAIRCGDLDLDGDLDLYVAKSDTTAAVGSYGEANRLLFNDGSGNFSDVTLANVIGLKNDNTFDADLVDLDGDGDLDVVCSNSVFTVTTANSNDVLLNRGGLQGGQAGMFVDNPNSFLEAQTPADGIRLSVQGADIDIDGDQDVLVTIHDLFAGADQLLFLNQGAAQGGFEGEFARQSWFDPGDFIAFGNALFDADGDGDLEVLITANGVITGDINQAYQTRFFLNTKIP